MSLPKRLLRSSVALLLASAVWLPCLHFLFRKPAAHFFQPTGLSPQAKALAGRQLHLWTEPAPREHEIAKMRASNAEWDFMARSFLVWSLANMSLREPASRAAYLETMDRIIDETLRLEQREGMYFFLMPYARARPYAVQPARSLFLDGEIALMLACRRVVEVKADDQHVLQARLDAIA